MPHPVAVPRRSLDQVRSSPIRAVADAGAGLPGLIPLWYGEGDRPTPDFICRAGADSLARGETLYALNAGLTELREAIGRYHSRLTGRHVAAGRTVVAASGMNAIVTALQAVVEPGDGAVVVGPVWPNIREAIRIASGVVHDVTLKPDQAGRWRLDLDALFAACDDRTRLIFVNSPSNPTGWMMTSDEMRAVLDFARARGIWLMADEVYNRIVYDRPAAPSFLDLAGPEDPLIVVQSFSKSWAMTGWRLGWLVAPERLVPELIKLIEFNVSCMPVFAQRAGVVALEQGEDWVAELTDQYREGREMVLQRLGACPRVRMTRPEAAFYAFFAVDGEPDSLGFAKRLVRETRVGVAPGVAFGADGEGYLRLCYAASLPRLGEALDRIAPLLG